MATWDELRAALGRAYEVTDLGVHALGLTFAVDDVRARSVLVSYAEDSDRLAWAHLDAPVGPLDSIELASALDVIDRAICGGLSRIRLGSADYLTVRHSVPLANLDWDDLDRPLRLMVLTAEAVAERLGPRRA